VKRKIDSRPPRNLKTAPPVALAPEPVAREFIDIPGAAAFVCASKATIRRMLTAGELRRWKFGSRTLIKIEELRGKIR
jgi:excisionase family DNA binding protein